MKHTVSFDPIGKHGKVEAGKSILQAAQELDVNLRADCGGKGTCGKCQVVIPVSGKGFSSPTDIEHAMLKDKLKAGYRLACQTPVSGPIRVRILPGSLGGEMVILNEGEGVSFKLDPAVRQYYLSLAPPSLADPLGDAERLLQALELIYGLKGVYIPCVVLEKLPAMLRSASWDVTVTIWEGQRHELIDIQSGYVERSYGAAVDIGTTTIVVYLVNLNNGEVVAKESMINPQASYGADIVARIAHAEKDKKGREELRRVVLSGINQLLDRACVKAGVAPEHIAETVVVGNTVMHHLLLGLDTQFLGRTPFTPVVQSAYELKAGEAGLRINPAGNVHLLPIVAGFVGSDVVSDLIAAKCFKNNEMTLLIDIGTNGELVLGNESIGLTACSVAAGPAFEGAHIEFGMGASPGAIEHVRIDPVSYEVRCQVIGGASARGICGSGIFDAIAEMLRAGIILPDGRINSSIQCMRLRQGREGPEFVLEWARSTGLNEDIVLTQKDVREVQLAKAAFYAGIRALTRHLKVRQIDRVLLAGAFGTCLDPKSAWAIGLLPTCEPESVTSVGNTAVQGAYMALLSMSERVEAVNVTRGMSYLELTAEPDFETFFLDGIAFPNYTKVQVVQ